MGGEQLGRERAHARRGDPRTSHEAATSVRGLTEKQRAVLHVISTVGAPITDAALIKVYGERAAEGFPWVPRQSESGIRTRREELRRKGLVREVDTVRLASGRRARRFECVFAGLGS